MPAILRSTLRDAAFTSTSETTMGITDTIEAIEPIDPIVRSIADTAIVVTTAGAEVVMCGTIPAIGMIIPAS